MQKQNNAGGDVMRYAGLGAQILVSLGIAVFAGYHIDKWVHNALFIAFRKRWEIWGVDQEVLLVGNVFLFIITLVSYLISKKGLQHQNPHVFTRSVMGSIMVKMFLSIIAAFIYISIYKKQINKPALFICMGLYLVYTFLEVSVLTRMLRQKPNV
ncbi:MAG: hypothetical protein EON98_04335 [Chitinophagaceae bacterium]|nr:MAG: hypothetical protein EON98_04335 [Chitinophagaceae bacterium]